MSNILQSKAWATDTRHLLAYMHRMAQTAQSADVKRLFTMYAQTETRRIALHGAFQYPADGGSIGARGKAGARRERIGDLQ